MTELIQFVINSMDKKDKVISISMDLTKAFDSVCHETLIDELNKLGVKGIALKCIKSNLQYG